MISERKKAALIEMIREFATAKGWCLRYEYDSESNYTIFYFLRRVTANTPFAMISILWSKTNNLYETLREVATFVINEEKNGGALKERDLDQYRRTFGYTPYCNDRFSAEYRERELMNYVKMDVETTKAIFKEYHNMFKKPNIRSIPSIEKVIFNDPATIVFWSDKTKTVVKAENEDFDPEKGLAMAISKKALGNNGRYFNEIKKWVEPWREEQEALVQGLVENILKGLLGSVYTEEDK